MAGLSIRVILKGQPGSPDLATQIIVLNHGSMNRNGVCRNFIYLFVNDSGEAEVQIRVTDMNDNVPYFKDRVYTARVPENTDPGTVVITVTAEDKDEGNKQE